MFGDNGFSRYSIFRDKGSLDTRYIPLKLPHRNSELEHLYHVFRKLINHEGEAPRNFLIMGASGMGKSTLSRFFGSLMEKRARRVDSGVVYVHADCFECRGRLYRILHKAVERMQPQFPSRGYSTEELLFTLQNQLKSRRAKLILALDRAEFFYHTIKTCRLWTGFDSSADIYILHIIDKEEKLEKLSFIEKGLLQHHSMKLRNYSRSDQRDIMEYREAVAFREDVFTPESRDLLLEAVSNAGGNIGYGIDLMYVAGEVAEENRERKVLPTHIEEAMRRVWEHIRNRELSMLNIHERLFLIGVVYCLEKKKGYYVTVGEAERCYGGLCKRLNLTRRRHNQILGYIERLSLLGLMEREIKSFGRGGRTSLLFIPEKPEEFLERELIHLGIK